MKPFDGWDDGGNLHTPGFGKYKVTIATHEDVSIGNYVFSHPKSSEITTVIVPRKRLLLTPNFDMNFGQVDLKQDYANYTYYLWGHSKRQRNFEYFKNLRNYGRMWKRFHRQFKYTADYSTTYLPKKVKQEWSSKLRWIIYSSKPCTTVEKVPEARNEIPIWYP